ncbi:hypothetical protein BU16DRAFT_172685 [Lophium mytilinum]|uniref:Bacteriophage T5 Orf172 DNA-binding domain-containing protein n=1 Tax=Lophium mytilinum TaxID=390894 RepID=A0A6A6Q9I1_9PEZI|nr:hypothetical protein BU16DRAFT_172685 [Lophium mytilinum]
MATFNELVDELILGLGVNKCFYSFLGHESCDGATQNQSDAQSILEKISNVPEEQVICQWLCGLHQNQTVIYMLKERVQTWKTEQDYVDASRAEALPSIDDLDTTINHLPGGPGPSPLPANHDYDSLFSTRPESEGNVERAPSVSQNRKRKPSRSSLGASFDDTTGLRTTSDTGSPSPRARSAIQASIPPRSPFSQGSFLVPNNRSARAVPPRRPSPIPPPPPKIVYDCPPLESYNRPRWNSIANPPKTQQDEPPLQIPHVHSSVSEPYLPLRENATLTADRSPHGGRKERRRGSSNRDQGNIIAFREQSGNQSSTANTLRRRSQPTPAPRPPGGFALCKSDAEPTKQPSAAATGTSYLGLDVEPISTTTDIRNSPSSNFYNEIPSCSDSSSVDESETDGSESTESRERTPEVATDPSLSSLTPTKRSRGRPKKAASTKAPATPNEKSLEKLATPKASTPRVVDEMILGTLCRSLPTPSPDKGFVYIMRDPLKPRHLKIGMTAGTITNRRLGHERSCKRRLDVVYLDDEDGKEQLPVANYKRAEKLVHDELAHRRITFVCSKCGRRHHEWFEVGEEVAKRTVRRWTGFMRMQPYDGQGRLGTMWKERLDYMARPKSGEKLDDYETREKRWNSVVTANRVDFFWHFVWRELFEKRAGREGNLAYRLVRMRWQLLCLGLSFSLCFFMPLGKWAPNVFLSNFFLCWWFFVLCCVGACFSYCLFTD